jgi:hypothetical protein
MNTITVTLQTLESTKNFNSNTNTKNWNNCDVCCKEMDVTHYTIMMQGLPNVNWVCSKECSNMFIFQNI